MKYCKDCKWSRPLPELKPGERYISQDDLLCAYPAFCNPATGNPFRSCQILRENVDGKAVHGKKCGIEAHLFEEKS